MKILFDPINIGLIIIGIVNLCLGLIILTKGKDKRVNRYYAWSIFAIVSWVVGMILFRSASADTSLFWCIILYISPTWIASVFLYFTYIFPNQVERNLQWRHRLIFLGNIVIVILVAIPGLIIKEVDLRPGLEKAIVFGELYILFALYISGYFIYGFIRLIRKYFKAPTRLEKVQIKYLLTGYALAANLAFITNLNMPWMGYYFLNWLGQYFTFFIISFTAYAIVVHRLMDVKLVLRRSLVYLSSLVTILVPIIIVNYIVVRFFNSIFDLVNIIVLFIAVLIFSPVKHYYYRLANKYFFSSLYDPQKVIAEISDKLRSSLDVHQICGMVCKILLSAFHTKKIGIMVFDQEDQQYLVTYNHGFQIGGQKTFSNDKILRGIYVTKNESMVVEEIKDRLYKKTKATIDLLRGLEVEILTPLNIKKKNVGLIVLGPKESGDMYNSEDLRVLKVVGAQTAVALQNALLYEESLAFGRKLKMEVKKATHDLRVANQRLKELDKLKTEFMSMASHQLRTPLSGIKGHLSMMIEGDYGQLKKNQKKVIQELYDNNERLVRLVNVFLNISRIESGRLTLNKEKVHIEDLVDKAVYQMKTAAQSKGLYLNYTQPTQPNPELEVDQDKIMDVILNFIDNAIKYTNQGGITIEVVKDKKKVVVQVKDTGVGIDRQLLAKLFSKFTRGVEASQMSTTGTGLGLFIAKKIVELHAGRIKAQSPGPGRGSTFSFELPII